MLCLRSEILILLLKWRIFVSNPLPYSAIQERYLKSTKHTDFFHSQEGLPVSLWSIIPLLFPPCIKMALLQRITYCPSEKIRGVLCSGGPVLHSLATAGPFLRSLPFDVITSTWDHTHLSWLKCQFLYLQRISIRVKFTLGSGISLQWAWRSTEQ